MPEQVQPSEQRSPTPRELIITREYHYTSSATVEDMRFSRMYHMREAGKRR